jgi:hypothetical protein
VSRFQPARTGQVSPGVDKRLDVSAEVFGAGYTVGTGYGEFEGWQFKSTIAEIFPGYAIETGYAFLPGG